MKSCSRCNCMCCTRFTLPTAASRQCPRACVWVSERVNIWEFCTSCCWYVCLFSLPYCRLIIFTGIFSCFTLDPCLVLYTTCIHDYAAAHASLCMRVSLCVFDERFYFSWEIFNIKWIYDRTRSKLKSWHEWMCVCRFRYTQALIHAQTHTLGVYLNDCTFVVSKPSSQTTKLTNRITCVSVYRTQPNERVSLCDGCRIDGLIFYTQIHMCCSLDGVAHAHKHWDLPFAVVRSEMNVCCHLAFSLISRVFMSSR